MPSNAAFSLDTAVRFFADEQSIAKVNQSISQLKSYARAALGAIGIGFSLKELNRMSEEYRSLKNSMHAVFGETEDLQKVQEKIKDTARDVRGEYDKIAQDVTTLVKNNRRVFDVDTANRFTDIMYKLTKLSGGNNSEASAAVQSLSSAMKNGKIDRGAIDQLINNVPQAIKVLTSYYGVSQERLRSMAQAGLIRSAQIRDAFLQAGEDVDKAFENVQLNITDVIGSFRSEFMAFIGETDEMLGITKEVTKLLSRLFELIMKGLDKARSGLIWLSDKLGGMENVLKLLVILAGSLFVAFHFKDIIRGLTAITNLFSVANLKVLALVAAIALVALLIDDFYHFMKGDKRSFFGDLFDAKGLDSDEIKKKVYGVFEDIAKDAKAVWKEVQWAVEQLGSIIESVFSGIKTWWEEGGGDGVAESITVFKDAIIDAWQAIKDWWDANGEKTLKTLTEFGESIGKAFEGALGVISSLFSLIVHILTGDEEKAEEDLQRVLEQLGLFLNGLFDAIFGKGFTDDALELGRSWIDNFREGLESGFNNIKEFLASVPREIKKAFGIPVEEEKKNVEELASKYEIVEQNKGMRNNSAANLMNAGHENDPKTLEELENAISDAQKKVEKKEGWNVTQQLLDLFFNNKEYKKIKEAIQSEAIQDVLNSMSRVNIASITRDMDADNPLLEEINKYLYDNSNTNNNQYNDITINQEFNGDAASEKNVAQNVGKAMDTSLDQMERAIGFGY